MHSLHKDVVSKTHSNCLNNLMSIRKVQAYPVGPQTAVPFRAGFALDLSYRDPDEMSAAAIHWGIEQSQLGSGRFDGGTRAIHSGQVQLSYSHRNPGLVIRGAAPTETVVLSSILRQSAPVFFSGRRVTDHQVMRTDARHEIDFRTIGRQRVDHRRRPRTTLRRGRTGDSGGKSSSIASPQIVFPCTIPSAGASSTRAWSRCSKRALRIRTALSDPDYGRNWELSCARCVARTGDRTRPRRVADVRAIVPPGAPRPFSERYPTVRYLSASFASRPASPSAR